LTNPFLKLFDTLVSCLLLEISTSHYCRPFSPVCGTIFAYQYFNHFQILFTQLRDPFCSLLLQPFPDPFYPFTGPFSLSIIPTIARSCSPIYGTLFAHHSPFPPFSPSFRFPLLQPSTDSFHPAMGPFSLTIIPTNSRPFFPVRDPHPVTGPFSLTIISTIYRLFTHLRNPFLSNINETLPSLFYQTNNKIKLKKLIKRKSQKNKKFPEKPNQILLDV